MEGVGAAMKTRHVEDEWLNRKEWCLGSGRRRQLSQDRKGMVFGIRKTATAVTRPERNGVWVPEDGDSCHKTGKEWCLGSGRRRQLSQDRKDR